MAVRPSDIERLHAGQIHELNDLVSNANIRLKQFFDPTLTTQPIPITFPFRPSQRVLEAFLEIYQALGWEISATPSRQSLLVMIQPKQKME